jgi:hypothetical protein
VTPRDVRRKCAIDLGIFAQARGADGELHIVGNVVRAFDAIGIAVNGWRIRTTNIRANRVVNPRTDAPSFGLNATGIGASRTTAHVSGNYVRLDTLSPYTTGIGVGSDRTTASVRSNVIVGAATGIVAGWRVSGDIEENNLVHGRIGIHIYPLADSRIRGGRARGE